MARQQMGPISSKHYDTNLVATAIQHEIDKASLSSFKFYTQLYRNVYLYPAQAYKQDTDSQGRYLGNLRYYFDLKGGIQKPVYVRMNNNCQIRIYYLGRWTRVSRLMDDMISSWQPCDQVISPADKESEWDMQLKWWRANGKTFRLLDLPLEIREMIYSLALVKKTQPYLKASSRGLSEHQRLIISRGNPNVHLLKVSRQIYAEASHIMFRDALFSVEYKDVFYRMSFNEAFWNRITRLEMALRHNDYLQLFGVVPEEGMNAHCVERRKYRNITAVNGLRYLKLTELVIHILPAQRVSPFDGQDRACLKAVIDRIFQGAFVWLKGHPVKVTGWTKTTQKLRMEAKCEEARREYLEWCNVKPLGYEKGLLVEWDEYMDQGDGGVRLDGEKRVVGEDFIDKGEELSENWARCECQPRCEFEKWSPEG